MRAYACLSLQYVNLWVDLFLGGRGGLKLSATVSTCAVNPYERGITVSTFVLSDLSSNQWLLWLQSWFLTLLCHIKMYQLFLFLLLFQENVTKYWHSSLDAGFREFIKKNWEISLVYAYCLSLSFSPALHLFVLGDVTSSEVAKWGFFLCCPSSACKPAVIIFFCGQDRCGEQSCTLVTIWLACVKYGHTSTCTSSSQEDIPVSKGLHTHTHTETNCTWTQRGGKAQLSPWFPCYSVILAREKLICLLIQRMLSMFWQFLKCCLHAATCCCY